jgi:hypothetical protein
MVDLLKQSGDSGHDRGSHLSQVFSNLIERSGVVHRNPAVTKNVKAASFKDMR